MCGITTQELHDWLDGRACMTCGMTGGIRHEEWHNVQNKWNDMIYKTCGLKWCIQHKICGTNNLMYKTCGMTWHRKHMELLDV